MKKFLDKDDLICLVRGHDPSYKAMDIGHPLLKKYGSYTGGFSDRWDWDYSLEDATVEELITLFKFCKDNK